MGISERVESMVVRAASPSGSVTAVMRGRGGIEVSFAPGFYQRASTHEIEQQLEQAARILWANRTREYRAILDDESGGTFIVDPPPADRRDEQFYEKREHLVAEGVSADGRVRVTVRGMRDWTVRVAAGTTDELREEELTRAAAQAAEALIQDQMAKITELKLTVYDDEADAR